MRYWQVSAGCSAESRTLETHILLSESESAKYGMFGTFGAAKSGWGKWEMKGKNLPLSRCFLGFSCHFQGRREGEEGESDSISSMCVFYNLPKALAGFRETEDIVVALAIGH